MIEFLQQHIIDIIEIILSFIAGVIGGITYEKRVTKQNAKIKGNNNSIIQKG